MICAAICALGLNLPAPPNPWTEASFAEATRSTLWRVSGPMPEDRCVIEIGDDAWAMGKGASPRQCGDSYAATVVKDAAWWTREDVVPAAYAVGVPGYATPGSSAPTRVSNYAPAAAPVIGGHVVTDWPRNPTLPETPSVAVVPLPASLGMLLAGVFGLIGWRVAT